MNINQRIFSYSPSPMDGIVISKNGANRIRIQFANGVKKWFNKAKGDLHAIVRLTDEA